MGARLACVNSFSAKGWAQGRLASICFRRKDGRKDVLRQFVFSERIGARSACVNSFSAKGWARKTFAQQHLDLETSEGRSPAGKDALPDVACCEAQANGLRWQLQRAAMTHAAQYDIC